MGAVADHHIRTGIDTGFRCVFQKPRNGIVHVTPACALVGVDAHNHPVSLPMGASYLSPQRTDVIGIRFDPNVVRFPGRELDIQAQSWTISANSGVKPGTSAVTKRSRTLPTRLQNPRRWTTRPESLARSDARIAVTTTTMRSRRVRPLEATTRSRIASLNSLHTDADLSETVFHTSLEFCVNEYVRSSANRHRVRSRAAQRRHPEDAVRAPPGRPRPTGCMTRLPRIPTSTTRKSRASRI